VGITTSFFAKCLTGHTTDYCMLWESLPVSLPNS
jgi:hypothetical protein